MDFNEGLEVFFAVTSLWMFHSLRHIKPVDIKSELDTKQHGKPLLPLSFNNKVLTFWTLVVPLIIIALSENIYPQARGLSHATNFVWRFCLTGILCQIMKLVISSPRPNAVNLENDVPNINGYIHDNSNFESRQSFFSGHAAAGFMSSLFLKSYLESKLTSQSTIHSLLYILPLLGMYPGYTQWRQYWHHMHDVLFGYLFGFLGYKIFFVWTYNF